MIYAEIDANKNLIQVITTDDTPVRDDYTYREINQEQMPSWAHPTPTSVLRWEDAWDVPAWVETASLAELKLSKRAEITAARLAADSDHFTYQGKEIKTADKDMFDLLVADARISKCADGEMPPNWPGGWKAIDNTYLPITSKEAWNAFFIAAYDKGVINFLHSQQLKRQLDDVTTPEEMAAITW
jgi:hypothetical protein